jgi:hypothetical protein
MPTPRDKLTAATVVTKIAFMMFLVVGFHSLE